ncbi:signal transduction histidine kinase [Jatrophihabitans sp. GAS493]|uniref:sensor histidine kinase n=1 Tax=Jatrophihabitans sp. GAS493 TaxID=1907575 RepID=UPI000BC03A7D|nr:histidine kinase [Jatrophihabitans sp. GAS493]SOD70504.1 signal transduction histidine kinase [Jatrophihabitans sp. GAS493]
MSSRVGSLSEGLRARYEAKRESHGLDFPLWIPLCTYGCGILFAIVAVAQRGALWPPTTIALAGLVAILPGVANLTLRWWVPWWLTLPVVLVGVGWLLSQPLTNYGPADAAPLVLMVVAAELTATEGAVIGLIATAASIALLVAASTIGTLPGVITYCCGVLLGLDVGYMMRWQMRALTAERAKREVERVQAALAERQRIAREVHDVVAHSLSVTLLHITGARHVLEEGADVAEALEALADAEKVGRQAMSDIRRTVSVLATEPSQLQPLPGVADIDELVVGFKSAGLKVAYEVVGDATAVAPALGLGLYRIAQESLANVAKHAPDEPVELSLDLTGDEVRLRVCNRLARPRPRINGGGSGVAGMSDRANQLGGAIRIGEEGDSWHVELTVPATDSPGALASLNGKTGDQCPWHGLQSRRLR